MIQDFPKNGTPIGDVGVQRIAIPSANAGGFEKIAPSQILNYSLFLLNHERITLKAKIRITLKGWVSRGEVEYEVEADTIDNMLKILERIGSQKFNIKS